MRIIVLPASPLIIPPGGFSVPVHTRGFTPPVRYETLYATGCTVDPETGTISGEIEAGGEAVCALRATDADDWYEHAVLTIQAAAQEEETA